MKIDAKLVLKSKHPDGSELSTLELTYPRFIHAELMTHRVFSRNASSSRAIPVKRLTEMALDDPAFFVHIGKNQPGMQANEEVDEATKEQFYKEWVELANINAEYAMRWADEYNIHKQCVNRVMEPWHHIKVLVSSTDWGNFFNLRCHKDAQPEIQVLANKIRDVLETSDATALKEGEWHIPYVSYSERELHDVDTLIKLSTARCARVSYMNHDGTTPDIQKDIDLHDKLVVMKPSHSSPAEHQARVELTKIKCSNFCAGWVQYRNLLDGK